VFRGCSWGVAPSGFGGAAVAGFGAGAGRAGWKAVAPELSQ